MSLGATLKSARESARLSLDDLAAMTSIRSGLIAQMEKNDFSGCGGDTYARGHLRTIATRLGLDVDEILAQYSQEHGVQERRIQDLLKESSVTSTNEGRRTISFKALSLASVAILAIAAIIQIIIANSDTKPSVSAPVVTSSPSPSESATPSISPSTETSPASATNTLKITATRGNASIDLVTKDGHVYKGWLLQGESKEVTAESRISIYVSNAGDVDVIFNGEAVGSLGAPNEEVRRTFG